MVDVAHDMVELRSGSEGTRDEGFRARLKDRKTISKVREHLSLIPFDILVIMFVGQSMLPAWAAFLLAAINFGTWWCYYRIPHFLRTVSGPVGDNILIPGPIVEYFARFIYSCGVHHRAHYGLLLAMMAGLHAAMTGQIWNVGITQSTALFMGWVCFAGLLLIDGIMFWVSLRTLQELKRDSLQDANEYTNELKRSNEDLEQFAYIASHDLRAPLRAMRNLTGWIEEDVEKDCSEQTKTNLAFLKGRIDRLDRLLNDLLQFSRIGQEKSAPEYIMIKNKVRDIFTIVDPGNEHDLIVNGDNIWVFDHDVTFEILIGNLIGNAIKHNDKDQTKIAVSIARKNNGLELIFEDNGPGIAKEDRQKIFDVFSTLQARDKREASGMGLAIVKKIVSQKDGSIEVTESRYGGAGFTISLPIPLYMNKPKNEPSPDLGLNSGAVPSE